MIVSGFTAAQMAQQTTKVVNQRAVFGHLSTRVASSRCQRETDTAFFCIVRMTNGYGTLYYNVSINSSGQTVWRASN